jgi:alpha-L-rhamnosidase
MEEYPNATVSQQIVRPIRQLQLVKAVSVTPVVVSNDPTPLTVYIFDMGQNAAGGVQLVVPSGCPAGHRILMYFGEVLYSINGSAPRARVSGPPSQGVLGTVDQSNLLGARGRVEYICAGSNVSDLYEPSFTYFGYQYVELVGFPGVPGLDTVQQRVMHSDVESTPSDTGLPRTPCGAIDMGGNQMLQYISSAVRETLISNLYSVPTDCPQRSERWGWMADGSLSAEANYHYHWVGDMCLLHSMILLAIDKLCIGILYYFDC